MCLAIPGQVVRVEDAMAVVDILGVQRQVAIDLVRDVQSGDYLMVHAGYAIEKVDPEEARRTIDLFRELDGMMGADERTA